VFRLSFTLILFNTFCVVRAQSVPTTIGARASGIGNTSTITADEWSMFNNVGSLSKTTSTVAGFSYESRPYLSGANRMAFVFAKPLKIGVAGIGLFRFGDAIYNEQIISTGYSNSFGLASLGLKINYIQYCASGFGSKSLLTISAGGLAQLTPIISVGVHITNLNQQKISDDSDKEYIPTTLTAGVGIKASDKVLIITEIEKDLSYSPIVKFGMEYRVHKKVAFRTGFNTNPSSGFFGMGFKASKFLIDYSFRYEPNLGGSHQATIGYIINTK
jgi:hypothetical protein